MAKCGCSGSTCGCKINGSSSVSVTGTGTAIDPYVVSVAGGLVTNAINVDDTNSIDMTRLGSGTTVDPYIIKGDVKPGDTVVTTALTGGNTLVTTNTRTQLFDHGSTIATHTLTLPAASTALEKEIKVLTISAITALTVAAAAGTTLGGNMPTTLAAGAFARFQLIGTVWRRVG